MVWDGFSQEGGVDESSYLVGSWSEIVATLNSDADKYYLGNCPEGTLEIAREVYRHEDTSFPRKTDVVIPIRAGMKFSGKLEEIHKVNVSFLLGQTLTPASNYIYTGALQTSVYFSLRGKRVRVSDGVVVEFRMHKCLVSSLFSLGSGDDAQGSPLEVEALNDDDGDYGGSSTDPLGWIWVPDSGA